MAYPYAPNNYYAQNPYYSPQMTNNNQPAINTPMVQNASQSANNGLIWVQGETGAKSYLVAPNNTILLMDSEAQRFYLKSADASGMPLPLRTFEYSEVTAQSAEKTLDKYITREEFDRRIAEISQKKKKTEGKEDE